MKKLLLFFWLALPCLLSAQLQAELITEVDSIKTLEYAFEGLDLSSLGTGRLFDKSFQLRNPKPYDGVVLNDRNFMSMLDFSLLYATLYNSAVSEADLLPAPDDYVDATLAVEDNSVVPIVAMTYDYHRFKEDAIDNNLISFSDDQFHEVPNAPESPYEIATLFAATPVKNYFYTTSITFSLPAALYYSESGVAVSNVEIDFGDGNGFQSLNFGDEITVNYGGVGENEIIFKYHYNNGSMQQGHAKVEVKEHPTLGLLDADNRYTHDTLPNLTQTFTITESNGDPLTMTARVYTVCEDSVVRKPFIYIEGFNPSQFGDLTPASMFFKLRNERPFDNITIEGHLENEGYDIIHVDIGNSLAAIQENAAVFEMVVNWVNGLKAASGSTERNMVMGESMGGVIAKFSLLTMEQNGLDHEVEHFISFDSPLRGANVPVSFQMMFTHVAYLDALPSPLNLFGFVPLKSFVPPLKDFDTVLRGTAPRQMLYHYIGDVRSQMGKTSLHEDFYAELAALGTSDIFTHTALSNGSQTGQLVDGLSPGGKLVNIHANALTASFDLGEIQDELGWWVIPVLQSAITGSFAIVKTKAMPDKDAPPKVIYDGIIKVTFLTPIIAISLPTSIERLEAFGNNPYDSAPGGLYGIDQEDIDDINLSATFHNRFFTFVPTVSSLDISSPENEDVLFDVSDEPTVIDNGNTLVERYIASPDATVESFGVNQHNQEHVEFTPINSRFLPLRFEGGERQVDINRFSIIPLNMSIGGGNSLFNSTYNFGTIGEDDAIIANFLSISNRIHRSISINEGGSIWVNREGKIGYTAFEDDAALGTTANPENQFPGEHFDLFIGLNHCDEVPPIIRIRNDGEFIIGDWTGAEGNTADVFLQEDAAINVEAGGLLEVDDNSRLIIQSGGEVTVQANGLLNPTWHSQIIVEAGGILRIESGGILRASQMAQVWVQPGGQLILEDGAIVQMWDGDGSGGDGRCNIKFGGPAVDPDNTPNVAELVIEGEFDWQGTGFMDIYQNMNVELVDGADFKIDGYGKGFRFMRINFDLAVLTIPENQCYLRNGKVEYRYGSSINLGKKASARFYQMEFDGHEEAIGLDARECKFVWANSSDFKNFNKAIQTESLTELVSIEGIFTFNTNMWLAECKFRDCQVGVEGLDITNTVIESCIFQQSSDAPEGIGIDFIDSGNLYLSYSNISNHQKGVHLVSTSDFVMRSGSIHHGDIGIHLDDTTIPGVGKSNVDLVSSATLEENHYGIWGVANPVSEEEPFPLITLDCAKLLRNGIGIRGRDLLLNLSGSSDLAPNHFQTGVASDSKIFEICYWNAVVTSIDASMNYWEGDINYKIEQSDNPYGFCAMEYNELLGGNTGFGDVELVIEPMLQEPPTSCSSSPGGGDPTGGGNDQEFSPQNPTEDYITKVGDCKYEGEKAIYDTYYAAYDLFLTESGTYATNHEASDLEFAKIAGLTNQQLDGYSEVCKRLVQKARSRVDGSGFGTQDYVSPFGGNQVNESYAEKLSLFPNPAKNNFTIDLGENESELRIFNRFGQLIFSVNNLGNYQVNTQNWQSGIYFIEVFDAKNTKNKQGRILIQQ